MMKWAPLLFQTANIRIDTLFLTWNAQIHRMNNSDENENMAKHRERERESKRKREMARIQRKKSRMIGMSQVKCTEH